jgi:hypothetical protein
MVESRHHGADPRAQRSSPSRPQCDRPQANCATAASGNCTGFRSRRRDVAVDRGVMGDRGRQVVRRRRSAVRSTPVPAVPPCPGRRSADVRVAVSGSDCHRGGRRPAATRTTGPTASRSTASAANARSACPTNRPRAIVVPIWASTISLLPIIIDAMVAAKTRPAEVTTPPVPAMERMMPVFIRRGSRP